MITYRNGKSGSVSGDGSCDIRSSLAVAAARFVFLHRVHRMPPDRGRASKACTACRKQKTRCYESGAARGSCLRCQRLELSCSLELVASEAPGHYAGDIRHGTSYDERSVEDMST